MFGITYRTVIAAANQSHWIKEGCPTMPRPHAAVSRRHLLAGAAGAAGAALLAACGNGKGYTETLNRQFDTPVASATALTAAATKAPAASIATPGTAASNTT